PAGSIGCHAGKRSGEVGISKPRILGRKQVVPAEDDVILKNYENVMTGGNAPESNENNIYRACNLFRLYPDGRAELYFRKRRRRSLSGGCRSRCGGYCYRRSRLSPY